MMIKSQADMNVGGRFGYGNGPMLVNGCAQADATIAHDPTVLPTFFAPLTTSLVPYRAGGSATPTFTRATVATVMGVGPTDNAVHGQKLLTVASGEARFQGARRISANNWSATYTDGTPIPSTLLLGYLAEGAATQLVTPTADIRDLTKVTWPAVTMTTALTSTGADGAANSATRCTATGASSTLLHVLAAAASSRTVSCYMRRVTGTGTIKLFQGASKSADLSSSLNSSTYTLVQFNANVDVTLLGYGIEIGTSGDAIDVDFVQFEAGGFATSRITTSATRNADILTYPSSGNATLGPTTIAAEIAVIGQTVNAVSVQIDDGSGDNLMTFGQVTGANKWQHTYLKAAVVQASFVNSGTATYTGVPQKVALIAATNNFTSYLAGASQENDTSVALATGATTIRIGNYVDGILTPFETIRNVRIWQRALSNAQIAAL